MINDRYDLIGGSCLDVDIEEFKKNIDKLGNHVQTTIENNEHSIVYRHNTYVAYCVIMLGYCNGHRPVNDMFCFRSDIDLEENILVINDKISSTATENRVCWFSNLARDQTLKYFDHLGSLSARIADAGNARLANDINSLPFPIEAKKQPIPLFFFLNEKLEIVTVSPSNLYHNLNNLWPYEDNHNRHYLETQLDRQGLHRSLIDLQLGHQQIHNHLLGDNTSWTASECAQLIKNKLNDNEIHGKWPLITGFTGGDLTTTQIKRSTPKELYGYQKRKKVRQDKLIRLKSEIEAFVDNEIENCGGIDSYIESIDLQYDSIKDILSEFSEAKNFGSKAISIFLLILNERAKKNNSRKINKTYLIKEEPSPFKDEWLSKYTSGRTLRVNFITYLVARKSDKKDQTLEEKWAEIVISSVIIGGMFQSIWCQFLLENGPGKLKKIKNWVYFIDIFCDDEAIENLPEELRSPNWRWQPDPFTRALVHQLLKTSSKSSRATFDSEKAKHHFSNILHSINVSKKNNPEEVICQEMQEYWLYHFPSFVRNIFLSRTRTTPLPQLTLARLCYGRRLSVKYDFPSERKKLFLTKTQDSNKRSIQEYLFLIKKILKQAATKNKTKRLIQIRELRDEIQFLHNKNTFLPIANALSQWLLHITEYGTERAKRPAINTIDHYFFSVALPLTLFIGEKNLDDITDEEISGIYNKVIYLKDTKINTKKSVAAQLYRFNLIINEDGITEFDNLDWPGISNGLLSKSDIQIDANIITPTEYTVCLKLINTSTLDQHTKSWLGMFLVIGYRFGLRISETHHLRVQDVQMLDDAIIIQVQKTIEGSKKTRSAIRSVPILGDITTSERRVITNHLYSVTRSPSCTTNTQLFRNPENIGELLSRGLIWKKIHAILRHVTGDKRIRFHHLRHSFITGQFIGNFSSSAFRISSELDGSIWSSYNTINGDLVEDNCAQAYLLASLSACSGHSKISTSIASYIHLADDIAIGYAQKAPLPYMSLLDLTYITGYSEKTLKNRNRKKRLNKTTFSNIELLKTIQISNTIEPYPFALERWPTKIPFDRFTRSVTLIDINSILTSAGHYRTPIDIISFEHAIDENIIGYLYKYASNLSTLTNYNHFGIPATRSIIPLGKSTTPKIYNYDKTNINKLLSSLDEKIANSSIRNKLKISADIWKKTIQLHDSGFTLVFKQENDIAQFLAGCELLGYESDYFYCSISNILDHNQRDRINTFVNQLGINLVKEEKLRRLSNGIKNDRLRFVQLKINKDKAPKHLPRNISSLSRIFFILLTKFAINEL